MLAQILFIIIAVVIAGIATIIQFDIVDKFKNRKLNNQIKK